MFLIPLENSLKEVLMLTWPIVLVSVVIFTSLRITYLKNNEKKFVFYKEALNLLFFVYILTLFQVVTFEDTVTSLNNVIPFKEIFRHEVGSRLFVKNVIGNFVMFIPFGFFVGYFTKTKNKSLSFFLILLASLTIETIQLFIGRVFDIDDILLNVLGGLFGYFVYLFIIKIKDKTFKFMRNEWFLNIIVTILCILLLGYIYKVMM